MTTKSTLPPHDAVAICAHGIYEHEGRPDGRDLEHWLQAEMQLVNCFEHESHILESESAL